MAALPKPMILPPRVLEVLTQASTVNSSGPCMASPEAAVPLLDPLKLVAVSVSLDRAPAWPLVVPEARVSGAPPAQFWEVAPLDCPRRQ